MADKPAGASTSNATAALLIPSAQPLEWAAAGSTLSDSALSDSALPEFQLPFPTVAIGASAGGVEALIRFFRAMPADSGCAFVIAMHLAPERVSMLATLIGAATAMPVAQAVDGVPLLPDHVHVVPPGHYLQVAKGRLEVEAIGGHPARPVVIDRMMSSLAADQHERAIGVVLSGADGDGSQGIRAIKGEGGLTIAQAPGSAAHSGMPRSAVATGLIDRQLQIEEMPAVILDFVRDARLKSTDPRPRGPEAAKLLPSILGLVRAQVGIDFGGYRTPMLERRIRRRMGLCRIGSEAGYLEYLAATPSEATSLAADFLISVTEFFREPQSWQVLAEEVVPELLAHKPVGGSVRAWVPACATGEEAYSVAMLLLEQPLVAERRLEVQVFASDIDRSALDVGRKGLYPAAIDHNVGAERLRRFFIATPNGYQVCRELREQVMFAQQNVVNDPPFSHLDLVSCRNLLIYLRPDLQRRVLRTFHFALDADGILALGKSEHVPTDSDVFVPVSRQARIFRRVGPTRTAADLAPTHGPARGKTRSTRTPPRGAPDHDRLIRQSMHLAGDLPAVVTRGGGQALYFQGAMQPYLDVREDVSSSDLFSTLRAELRTRFRTVLHLASARGTPVESFAFIAEKERGDRTVRLVGSRIGDPSDDCFLVTFERLDGMPDGASEVEGGEAAMISALERELREVKRELRASVEDLESTNEELKVANEEAMSMNEELQSSNEELATSKEELQSMNEEIITVNAQLQEKVGELETSRNDLVNLLASTHIPTLVLDRELRIKRFTPAANRLFRLIPSDVDRPLTDLATISDLGPLLDDARRVLETLAPIERETRTADGGSYLRRTLAYRTHDDRIEGVVVTFVDVTQLKRSAEELRRYAAVMLGSNDAVIVIDAAGRILAWNSGAQSLYGYTAEEALDTELARMLPEDSRAEFRTHLDRALAGERIVGIEVKRRRKDGSAREVSASFSLIAPENGAPAAIALTERDVTQRKRAEVELHESEQRFRILADSAPVLIWVADEDGALEFVNGQFVGFTGLRANELLGRRWVDLLHADDRAGAVSAATMAAADGERSDVTGRLRAADGSWRWMKIATRRRQDVPGWIGSLVDINDQIDAEHAMRRANERKDEFLAMLGHELRNPMVPIRNAAEVLNRVVGDDSRIRWVRDTLVRQVDHVTRLVEDLVDISLITRSAMRLQREPVDLRAVADRACDAIKPLMQRKRHHFECSDGPPIWVEGDAIRLTQIFENLLTNAAKYTHDGGHICLKLAQHGDQALVCVTDDGIGIEPSMQNRVFDLFVQDERSVDRSEGGLGIGLALVRHLVELHGGRVEAHSVGLGKGTEINAWLPLLRVSETPQRIEPGQAASAASGRVMVVDDDPDIGESTSVVLALFGYEVEHATNLEQALETARRFAPHAVLLDLAMPHADGFEVRERLRALPAMREAIYLSVSGFGQPEAFRRSERAGFVRHLVKPVNPEELDAILRSLLEPPKD